MKKVSVIVFFILAVAGAAFAVEIKSPAVLLQQGIYAEESEGNLEKAMEIYSQIRSDYNDVERITAIATYQLGLCNLKKDKKQDAIKLFQEVVDYYPNQTVAVKKAQQQLDKLGVRTENQNNSKEQNFQELANDDGNSTGRRSMAYTGHTVKFQTDNQDSYLKAIKIYGSRYGSDIPPAEDFHIYICDKNFQKIADFPFAYSRFQKGDKNSKPKGWVSLKIDPPVKLPAVFFICADFNPTQTKGVYIHHDAANSGNSFIAIPGHELKPADEMGDWLIRAIVQNPQQLDKLGNKNIFDLLGQASVFIGTKYGESCAEAGMKKLYSNGHIYVVDKDFIFRNGGIGYVMNFSDKPITGKYRISGTTQPNQKLYGVMNEPIDVEILPDPNRNGFYNIYWTPKEPFLPGGFFSYGWETDRSRALAKTEQGYQLKMNNHFGDRCFETFFLAVPEGMQIVEKSEEYTGKQNIDGWDIYWWKKEVMPNTDHTVNVTLNDVDPAPILDIVPAKVRECIVNSFYKTFEIAQKKGLRTNSHIHIIDQNFNRNFGMVHIFHNSTNQVIDGEVRLGSNDTPDIYLYNEKGVKQEIRTVKIPGSNYDLFWTPSEPIKPDETRMLCYSLGENKLYTDSHNQYILRMNNHFGSPVIENFYVVLPANIELASQSEPFTNYETVGSFKVYCWSKEQGTNINHRVDITLAKKK